MNSKQKRMQSAQWFFALGHHRRILICDLLRASGTKGLRFEILCLLSRMSPSTLTHHLMHMDNGGLLRRKIKGRETWISLDLAQLAAVPPTGLARPPVPLAD